MSHSLLHSPDKVGFGALVEMVEEVGDVLVALLSSSQLYIGKQFGFGHVESGKHSVDRSVIVGIFALHISYASSYHFAQHTCEHFHKNEYHYYLFIKSSVGV